MQNRLKILHLEDSSLDADLIRTKLETGGLNCEINLVDSEKGFTQALNGDPIDLILADRLTPTFDGMSVLKLAREKRPNIPFIFVSGTLDEEAAIESLKNGATDYVLKDRLSRLVPAVKRAVEEAKNKKEKQILEQQLLQAQKMESLGTLVGGIAHDFNNILAIIQGYGELLQSKTAPGDERSEAVQTIKQATQRGTSLVRQLLTFARKSEAKIEEVDVNQVINDLLKMLAHTFPKTIEINTKLDKEVPRIFADPTHLHQALLNLCVNARDAMPNGGKLMIATGSATEAEFREKYPDAQSEFYVWIQVSDTGCGMDAETKRRIFDPFFTTKGKDEGTGLGLAVVYGVVHGHEGFVDVESELGKGTTFRLFLPSAAKTKHETQPLAPAIEEELKGNETILLVEDEAILRNLVKNYLEAKGYKVITAEDGQQAIETYSRHRKEIDLVVSDLGLPQVDGLHMFLEIKKMNPDVRVILCSGFLQLHMKSEILTAGVKDFVMKPYAANDVLRKIRNTLKLSGKLRLPESASK